MQFFCAWPTIPRMLSYKVYTLLFSHGKRIGSFAIAVFCSHSAAPAIRNALPISSCGLRLDDDVVRAVLYLSICRGGGGG